MVAVTGTFTAVGSSASFDPSENQDDFNVSVWGTFVATLQLERTFDNGANWLPVTALDQSMSFTTPFSTTFSEPEDGVQYRLRCTAYTSGTINYRLSQ